jgi:hypothetical protein
MFTRHHTCIECGHVFVASTGKSLKSPWYPYKETHFCSEHAPKYDRASHDGQQYFRDNVEVDDEGVPKGFADIKYRLNITQEQLGKYEAAWIEQRKHNDAVMVLLHQDVSNAKTKAAKDAANKRFEAVWRILYPTMENYG